VGTLSGGFIEENFVSGTVDGEENVGGMVGYALNSADIIMGESAADVTGLGHAGFENSAGGLIGRIKSEDIGGAVIVKNSRAIGTVTGAMSALGGLIGKSTGSASKITIIENSFARGNITVNDGPNTTTNDFGGFIGVLERGYIFNSFAKGNVTAFGINIKQRTGGFVGIASMSNINIGNSHATGTVDSKTNTTGNTMETGGFVGYFSAGGGSKISSSYSRGNVLVRGQNAGGFVGNMTNGAIIMDSFATGNLNSSMSTGFGGFVGKMSGAGSPVIQNVYSTGDVTYTGSNFSVGGFVGNFAGGTNIIAESFTTGDVSSTGTGNRGPFVGLDGGGTLSNTYYFSGAICSICDNGFGFPQSPLSYFYNSTNAPMAGAWDFTNTGKWIDLGVDYPILNID